MNRGRKQGYTLVEILVVMAIMGVMTSAIYGLYLSTQKTASSQEEVVELQQNLRIAMDQLARDIRMAGYLVSIQHPPILSAPNQPASTDMFVLLSACPTSLSGYLAEDLRIENATEATFRLASAEMVDVFSAHDQVRVLRPVDQGQPIAKLFDVTGTNRTARTVTVEGFDPLVDVGQYKAGDMLVISSATFPGTVSFYLKENEIFKKISDGYAQRVTAKKLRGSDLINGMTGFDLEYVMGNGETQDRVDASALRDIRAVRIVLTGLAQVQGRASVRSLSSVISLRNR